MSNEGLTDKKSNLDSAKNGNKSMDGEIPKSFQYTPEMGTGFRAAAIFIIENSGDSELVKLEKRNPNLVSEVAKAYNGPRKSDRQKGYNKIE